MGHAEGEVDFRAALDGQRALVFGDGAAIVAEGRQGAAEDEGDVRLARGDALATAQVIAQARGGAGCRGAHRRRARAAQRQVDESMERVRGRRDEQQQSDNPRHPHRSLHAAHSAAKWTSRLRTTVVSSGNCASDSTAQ